jgi:uncharacterized protein (TIGR03085 family)
MPETTNYPEQVVRGAFVDLLTKLGPDAPTLCEGWTAQDIAIHMVLIERHPEAWLGIPVGDKVKFTRGYFDGLVETERKRPWAELVERVRVGPKRGPLGNAAFRNRMMFREYLVHGEDIRRANDVPAEGFGHAVWEATWKKAQFFARFVKTTKGHGLEIAERGGRVQKVRDGSPTARITGEPLDVLLYEFGRIRSAVDVEVSGDPEAVAGVSVHAAGAQAMPRMR